MALKKIFSLAVCLSVAIPVLASTVKPDLILLQCNVLTEARNGQTGFPVKREMLEFMYYLDNANNKIYNKNMLELPAQIADESIRLTADTSDKDFISDEEIILNRMTGRITYRENLKARGWVRFNTYTDGSGTCQIIDAKSKKF